MSLDDKLREILNEFGNSIKDQSSWMMLGGEYEPKSDPIAQIKQAFTEEYWDSLERQTMYFQDLYKEHMTGQEFYDRFEKEIDKVQAPPHEQIETYEQINRPQDAQAIRNSHLEKEIMSAAQRAAGLDNG